MKLLVGSIVMIGYATAIHTYIPTITPVFLQGVKKSTNYVLSPLLAVSGRNTSGL